MVTAATLGNERLGKPGRRRPEDVTAQQVANSLLANTAAIALFLGFSQATGKTQQLRGRVQYRLMDNFHHVPHGTIFIATFGKYSSKIAGVLSGHEASAVIVDFESSSQFRNFMAGIKDAIEVRIDGHPLPTKRKRVRPPAPSKSTLGFSVLGPPKDKEPAEQHIGQSGAQSPRRTTTQDLYDLICELGLRGETDFEKVNRAVRYRQKHANDRKTPSTRGAIKRAYDKMRAEEARKIAHSQEARAERLRLRINLLLQEITDPALLKSLGSTASSYVALDRFRKKGPGRN